MPSHNIIRLNKHSKSSYLYSCLHSFLHRFVETIRKFWSISCSLVFYYTRETKGNRFQNLDVPRNNGRVEPFFRSETKGRILKVWQPTKDLENPSSRIPPTVTTDSCPRVMPRTGIKREACRRCSSVDGNKWTKEPTRNGERKEEREREIRCAKTCRCHDRDFCACISLFSLSFSLSPLPPFLLVLSAPCLSEISFPLCVALVPCPYLLVLAFLPTHEAPFTRYLDLPRPAASSSNQPTPGQGWKECFQPKPNFSIFILILPS